MFRYLHGLRCSAPPARGPLSFQQRALTLLIAMLLTLQGGHLEAAPLERDSQGAPSACVPTLPQGELCLENTARIEGVLQIVQTGEPNPATCQAPGFERRYRLPAGTLSECWGLSAGTYQIIATAGELRYSDDILIKPGTSTVGKTDYDCPALRVNSNIPGAQLTSERLGPAPRFTPQLELRRVTLPQTEPLRLPSGRFRLEVRATGYAPFLTERALSCTKDANLPLEIEARLKPILELTIRGAPQGARVELEGIADSTQSLPVAKFSLPEGKYRVKAQKRFYLEHRTEVQLAQSASIELNLKRDPRWTGLRMVGLGIALALSGIAMGAGGDAVYERYQGLGPEASRRTWFLTYAGASVLHGGQIGAYIGGPSLALFGGYFGWIRRGH